MVKQLLTLVVLSVAAPAAFADPMITVGPMTFGSSVPLRAGEWMSSSSVAVFLAPEISQSTPASDLLSSRSVPFAFSLASGWSIDHMNFLDGTQVSAGDPYHPATFAAEFAQRFTFCTVDSTCSKADASLETGNLSLLPPLSLTGSAAAGEGLYEEAVYTRNGTVQTEPLASGLNIFLTYNEPAAASAPELDTLLLTATGAIGCLGFAARRGRTC